MITMSERRTGSTTDTLAGMPVPSGRLKDDVADDLDHHASIHWPQLGEVRMRWHGGYGYVIGYLDTDEPDDEHAIPLCRLGYLGADDDWEFALYDPATDTYTDTVFPDGALTGTPQDALDCACQLHLADIPTPPPQPL
jgi:hypothetical protein